MLFNEVQDHVLRADRIFRQPQGHLLLIGVSGAGKTTLSRFVAGMNGRTVFQIKEHNKYSGEDFDEDLRQELRRSGCKDEKICFILDELGNIDKEKSLARPILVSNWRNKNYIQVERGKPREYTVPLAIFNQDRHELITIIFSNRQNKNYIQVERGKLRDYTKARLKEIYEEELDVPHVLYNEAQVHVLRTDRIFRQPQGHRLLIHRQRSQGQLCRLCQGPLRRLHKGPLRRRGQGAHH